MKIPQMSAMGLKTPGKLPTEVSAAANLVWWGHGDAQATPDTQNVTPFVKSGGTYHDIHAPAGSEPTMHFNYVNGHKAIRFNGAFLQFYNIQINGGDWALGANTLVMFAATRQDNAALGYIVSSVDNTWTGGRPAVISPATKAGHQWYSGQGTETGAVASSAPSEWGVYTFQHEDGQRMVTRCDGVQVQDMASVANLAGQHYHAIGCVWSIPNAQWQNPCWLYLGDFILFVGGAGTKVPLTDVVDMENRLRWKYATP